MAVFEFRGIQIAPVSRSRATGTRTTPKTLRALLRREGVLLTLATEESERKAKKSRNIDLLAFGEAGRRTSDVAIDDAGSSRRWCARGCRSSSRSPR